MTFTLEDIPKMTRNELIDLVTRYYKHLVRNRKENSRSYNKPEVRKHRQTKNLARYYVRKGLYHPEFNPNAKKEGTKYKRPVE